MDSARRSARQSVDPPKPESDLAEWASKIKAMQRQVDADEETEQQRLEEEIAVARQARLRRSRQFSGRPLDGIDSSRSVEQLSSPSPSSDPPSLESSRDATTDRHGHQSEALRKLMGQNAVHVPERRTGEPVSLASFIGGRATGPRLNRHAPQADTHDPTQFNQPDLSAPHPIFGKGGIAMPGMVSKQDLGGSGGLIPRKDEHLRPAADLKPISVGLKPSGDSGRYSNLRTPTSPNSIVGSEAFERYRPSASPTPKLPLKSQKSSDKIRDTTNGTKTAERYRPSPSPTPRSTLKSQKSSDRLDDPSTGTTAERYRPSASPSPMPTLKPQKSADRIRNTSTADDSERYRPSNPSHSTTLKQQKSSDRMKEKTEDSGRYRGSTSPTPKTPTSQRSFSTLDDRPLPQHKAENYSHPAAKSTPNLRTQKSWSREEPRPVSPQKSEVRERAMSVAKPLVPEVNRPAPRPLTTWGPPAPAVQSSSKKDNKAVASTRERTISTPSYLPKGPAIAHQIGRTSVITTPSLARPIQPEPRPPVIAPAIHASMVPSPAFQKSPPQKDLSPSISRLQGRGFVQNMVKSTLQLDPQSSPSPAKAIPSDKTRPATSGRKGSVLDRWQPQNQASPSPPASPTKPSSFASMRRSTTADPTITGLATPKSVAFSSTTPKASLTPAKQHSQLTDEPLTPRTTARFIEQMPPARNLGSATTMFVEKPYLSSSSISAVDELGVKHEVSQSQSGGRENPAPKHHIPSEIPAPTGKPLIHPTKDRARKPKKGSTRSRTIESCHTDSVILREETVEKLRPQKAREMNPPSPQAQPTPLMLVPESKVGRLTEHWINAGPIVPRESPSPSNPEPLVTVAEKPSRIRYALPGLAAESSTTLEPPQMSVRPTTPKKSFERPSSIATAIPFSIAMEATSPVPSSPNRHMRIPSTGNRATVMEVAQALSDRAKSEATSPPPTPVASDIQPPKTEENNQRPRSNLSEKRKSSYERYSAIALPSVKEETTPNPSPAGTLSRSSGLDAITRNDPVSDVIVDEPLPEIDISIMFRSPSFHSILSLEDKTISVEILTITGSTSNTLTQDTDIFYDTEALAIVHRSKSKSSGLVNTFVWGWLGKRCQFGEKEEKKLHEIARRYGTIPVIIRQCAEPSHLAELFGGRLAIRQGSRAHWNADNTAMHLVRSTNGVILIDEHDLSIKNLCSAFSYCISILETVYVWHGSGSTTPEQEAAVKYAQAISKGSNIVELHEGENDDDDMFWMILGQDTFANADYWKWRSRSPLTDPSIWRVDSSKRTNMLSPVQFLTNEANPGRSVYVINCIWELFILVGQDACNLRQDIRLALDIADKYAKQAASDRPYTPTVHVVILPSQLPLDLRLHVRDLDENILNHGEIPDHMNLLSSVDASEQLKNRSWLGDSSTIMSHFPIPLGLDASNPARHTSSL